MHPRGLIVHQWRDRNSDSNENVYFEFSFHFAFVVSLFQEHGASSITFSIHENKQNKNTTQNMLDTTMRKQIQIRGK